MRRRPGLVRDDHELNAVLGATRQELKDLALAAGELIEGVVPDRRFEFAAVRRRSR
jgi:hypothetical protein